MMSTRKAWLLYSTIRLGLFAGIFALVWWLGARWWLAALLAALISMAISILLLDPIRQRAAEGLQDWRNREHTDDSLYEDDVIDENPTLLDRSTADQAAESIDEVAQAAPVQPEAPSTVDSPITERDSSN